MRYRERARMFCGGLCVAWLPGEVALEFGQHHVACFDAIKQIQEALGVGVFVDGHAEAPYFSKKAQAVL